jgi:drug/metabolite transporter (DMT)-like permease
MRTRIVSQRLKADLALVFCTVIWGATFVVVKEALAGASVFAFIAVRFTLAALLMAGIFHASLRRLDRAALWAGVQLGFLMFSGYAFQTLGLYRTTPTKAGFITGFSVVLVPILLAAFWGWRTNAWVWSGALAAFIGLYFLSVPPGDIGPALAALNLGDLLVLGCAVMFALHVILVGRYSPRHSVGALSLLQVATTAVLGALAIPMFSVSGLEAARFTWSLGVVSAILITAVGATAIAFSVQVWAQQYTTATHAAIIFSLEPVCAAITSYIVLGERLGGRALVGAALVLAGIVLAELKGPAQVAPES